MNHEAIRRALLLQAGDAVEASAVATATVATWLEAAIRLTPVIGGEGVDMLFHRALQISAKDFPWLVVTTKKAGRTEMLVALQTHMSEREMEIALEASVALLAAFADLLAHLIGESLTDRLLGPIWAPPLPASEQE